MFFDLRSLPTINQRLLNSFKIKGSKIISVSLLALKGGSIYEELWVPAEQLNEFNGQIVQGIEIEAVFYGSKYKGEKLVS